MVGVGVAFLIALSWSMLAIPLGARLGIVDCPDDSSLNVHEHPAVPLGGIGVFAAVTVGMGIAGNLDVGAMVAAGLLLATGLVDDLIGLRPSLRLAIQFGAGWWLAAFADLPDGYHTWGGKVVVVVVVVVAVNAVNLFDGLDGLAAVSGIVSALGIASLVSARGGGSTVGMVLAAGLLGFLILNWPPARVFLGDNGAYVVGFYLAYGILRASPGVGWPLVLSLLMLGVFALDLVATVMRRRVAGARLFSGDRSHLYDQLRDRGMSVVAVVVTAGVAQTLFVVTALLLDRSTSVVLQAGLLVGIAAAIFSTLVVGGFLTPDDR